MTDINPSTQLILAPDKIGYVNDVTYEQAASDFEAVRLIGVRSKLVLGYLADYIMTNFGEDRYTQLLDASRFQPGYLRNILYVWRNIYPENRRYQVSWSHLQIAATIKDEAEQSFWLQRCIDESLSRKGFAALLNPPALPSQAEFFHPLNDRSALYLVEAWLDGRAKYSKKELLEIIRQYLKENAV